MNIIYYYLIYIYICSQLYMKRVEVSLVSSDGGMMGASNPRRSKRVTEGQRGRKAPLVGGVVVGASTPRHSKREVRGLVVDAKPGVTVFE